VKTLMFIKGNKLAQCGRRKRFHHQRYLMDVLPSNNRPRHEPIWGALCFVFLNRLARGERLCLRKDIRDRRIFVVPTKTDCD